MPPFSLVCLSKGRIESTDEVAQCLALEALRRPSTGTGEDPGMLFWMPDQ
jgi:hypothetical protein